MHKLTEMKLFYFNNILNSSIKYNHELGEFLETWQILIHEGDRHNMGSMSFRGVVRCIALFFVYLKILNNFINGPVFSSSFITCLMCFLLRFFIWCWFFIVERGAASKVKVLWKFVGGDLVVNGCRSEVRHKICVCMIYRLNNS